MDTRLLSKTLSLVVIFFCVANAHAQIVWGTKSKAGQPPDLSQPPSLLFRYDPVLNTANVIDTVRVNGSDIDMDGLAYTPALGLVGWEHFGNGCQMIRLDTLTAEATPFGVFLPGVEICGACWDQDSDILAMDRNGNTLLRISGWDGGILSSLPLTLSGAEFPLVGGDIACLSGKFYLHTYYTLYEVDTVTGNMYPIWEDTAVDNDDVLGVCANNAYPPGIGGMAAIPTIDTHTYIALDGNCEDDIYRYDIYTPTTRLERINDITPGFNSGNIDLASALPSISAGLTPRSMDMAPLVLQYGPGRGLIIQGLRSDHAEVRLFDAQGDLIALVGPDGSIPRTIRCDLPPGIYTVVAGEQRGRFIAP